LGTGGAVRVLMLLDGTDTPIELRTGGCRSRSASGWGTAVSHDAAGENEILSFDLPADVLAAEPARSGFVCYRDAARSDAKSLRRSRVPKPSALLPHLSRICFATGSSTRGLLDARAGPALHRHGQGWKAGKHLPVSSQFQFFLRASRRTSKKEERANIRPWRSEFPLKTTKTPLGSDSMVHPLAASWSWANRELRRDAASTLLRDFRSRPADNAPGPCA
jgi:hypothetical protein